MSRSSSVASATSAAAYYDMPPMPDALQRKLCVGFRTNSCKDGADGLASHDMHSWLTWRDYHMACQARAAAAGGGARSTASSRTPGNRESEPGQGQTGNVAAAAAWASARPRAKKGAKPRSQVWRARGTSVASGIADQSGTESGGPTTALRPWGGSVIGAPRAYEEEDWDSVPQGLPPCRAVVSEVCDLGFEGMMSMDGPDGA